MEINYSVTKAEIMKCYWKRWRSQLWKIHVIYFLIFFEIYFS